jgi:hypothetical protein
MNGRDTHPSLKPPTRILGYSSAQLHADQEKEDAGYSYFTNYSDSLMQKNDNHAHYFHAMNQLLWQPLRAYQQSWMQVSTEKED